MYERDDSSYLTTKFQETIDNRKNGKENEQRGGLNESDIGYFMNQKQN